MLNLEYQKSMYIYYIKIFRIIQTIYRFNTFEMIDGVSLEFDEKNGIYIAYVEDFSHQIKELIRKMLSSIWHGQVEANERPQFNYHTFFPQLTATLGYTLTIHPSIYVLLSNYAFGASGNCLLSEREVLAREIPWRGSCISWRKLTRRLV